MTLQAIICLADGSTRVVVDGVECPLNDAELSEEDRAQVNSAQVAQAGVPPPSPDTLLAWRKAERAAAVAAIVVTTTSGKTFDGDEDSQARMSRALLVAQITGQTETTWVLANNVPTLINLDELREALALSMQAQSAVWSAPNED